MLGKLLKHEFRATGRIMLPVYGAMLILAVLANLSMRYIDGVSSGLLRLLFILVIIVFFAGIVAAAVVTLVVMVGRFYRSLLREQGYLMHTLPVTVHGHIWSKLIVSLVWFIVTFLLVWLAIMLTALIQSGTDLGALLTELPSWADIRQMLAEAGIGSGDLTLIAAEFAVFAILSCLTSCLHFYCAMTIGHMFAESKILLSVVFYVAISILFSLSGTRITMTIAEDSMNAETMKLLITTMQGSIGMMLLAGFIQGAILYIATALGLKKGMNLA